MRKQLEFQADRIEAVLALNKVPARVTGGTVTPRWVRFQVLPAIGAKISKIKGLSEEMAAALNASNCRVSRRGAAVSVEVPRDDPKPVRLLPLYSQLVSQPTAQPAIPSVTAVLGLAEDGAPLLIRLPSPDVAHILVAGTTGSGKTVLLQTMILSLAMVNPPATRGRLDGISLVLIDPKYHAFHFFEGLPHLARPVIWEMEETTEVLHSLVRLMERRSGHDGHVDRNGNGSWGGQPHVVVVIDELADLLMVGGKEVQWALTRLTQRGREAGIHIVAATQKPTTAVLGPLVKANFPVRLAGRVTSVEDARTATGWSGTGAERLTGQGDFLAVAEGRVIRFQVAHVSPAEIQEAVRSIRNNGWRVENGLSEVLPAIPSQASAHPISLPRPADWLTEVFRGRA
jgi:S-DNA-T family DNA segregation ATPase FtsK/SpoIIIE